MEFTVAAPILLDGLQKVVSVIPAKTSLPILGNILFQVGKGELKLTATDLEVSMSTRVPVEVKTAGSIALPGRIVYDIVRQLPETNLTFVGSKENRVTLQTDAGEYGLSGEDEKDFPTLPTMDIQHTLEVSSVMLSRMIDKTIFAVSTGEIRSSLMGVFMQFLKGKILAVSTDGHRLVKISHECDAVKKEIGGSIVSTKALNLYIRNCENVETTTLSIAENYIVFEIGNTTIYSRLLEGVYPDYEKVLPTGSDKSLISNRSEMEQCIRRVIIFSNKMTQLIRLSLSAEKCELRAQDADFGKQAFETIHATFEGNPLEIGYNGQYMLDILRHMDTDNVHFSFTTPTSAGLVTPSEQQAGEELRMLVMPIKLTD